MKCSDFQKLISDGLDSKLNPRSRKKLEEHLRVCSVCLEYQKDLMAVERELRSLPEIDLPGELIEEKLRARLARIKEESGNGKERKINLSISALKPVWITVSVALIAIMIYLFVPAKRTADELMPQFSALLSYEDSYLLLSQLLNDSESLQEKFNSEIIEGIYREIGGATVEDSEAIEIYPQKILDFEFNNNNLTENLKSSEEI
ncbi:MAG: zf-HC2 domain-containing protein [Candidatus Saccharicenans sp.]